MIKKLNDNRTWSTIDNTAPHVKVFSQAFKDSKSYIQAKPLSVNIWRKEWSSTYPFVAIIRIPEILELYRKNGLTFIKYIKYKLCTKKICSLHVFYFKK